MANNIIQQFIEVLENDMGNRTGFALDASEYTVEETAYDFIANHYMEFSKIDLADIIKELLYALWNAQRMRDITAWDYEQILDSVVEELKNRYDMMED